MRLSHTIVLAFGAVLFVFAGTAAWEFLVEDRHHGHWQHVLVATLATAIAAVICILLVYRTNRQRQRAETALATSEQALNQSQRVARLAHWRWCFTRRRLTMWSGEFPEIFAITNEEVNPEDEGQFHRVHPDDRDRLAAVYKAATADNPGFDVQYRIVHPDGAVRYVREVAEPEHDADGRVVAHFGIIQDITEQRQAEEALRENEARFRDFALSSADSFWEMDADLRFTWFYDANPASRRRPVHANLGKTRWDAIGGDPDRDPLWRAHRADLEARRPFRNLEYRFELRPGESVWWRVSGVPVFDQDGTFTGYRGMSTEITAQKDTEAQRDRALAEATEANRAKSAFLANVSHETRTPMHGVLAMAKSLLGDDLDAAQRQKVDVIKESGEALLDLLNDTLDLSKIEAGKLTLEPLDFSLRDLLNSTEVFWQAHAKAKTLSFQTAFDLEGLDWIRADRMRLRQILFNMIGNAIKFTDRGEVRLSVSIEGVDARALAVEVADTGIGIEPDRIKQLFAPFEQADASVTRRFGGTGLGLAISHQLVDLMGGKIGADSTPGQGSRFWFTVPVEPGRPISVAKPEPAQSPKARQPTNRRPLRILAAEDNHINQVALRAVLEPLDWNLDVVENGALAVAAVRDRTYDVVIMDAQMPEMDGITATQKIRALPGRSGSVPIIAVTAHAMKGDREKYLSSGMTDYLSKPFDADDLINTILACCDAEIPQPATRAVATKRR